MRPGCYVKKTLVWAEIATEAGRIKTKEGATRYRKGDYLVYNHRNGRDGYSMSPVRVQGDVQAGRRAGQVADAWDAEVALGTHVTFAQSPVLPCLLDGKPHGASLLCTAEIPGVARSRGPRLLDGAPSKLELLLRVGCVILV